jgi:putative FmdB family regulatory protein
MPIFEYLCTACGNLFEKVMKSGENGEPDCPKCGSSNVEKQLSSFAAPAGASPAGGGCGHSSHGGGG